MKTIVKEKITTYISPQLEHGEVTILPYMKFFIYDDQILSIIGPDEYEPIVSIVEKLRRGIGTFEQFTITRKEHSPTDYWWNVHSKQNCFSTTLISCKPQVEVLINKSRSIVQKWMTRRALSSPCWINNIRKFIVFRKHALLLLIPDDVIWIIHDYYMSHSLSKSSSNVPIDRIEIK